MKNCQLFADLPFTNICILCDFAAHCTPTFSMAEETASVAFFLLDNSDETTQSQFLGFPTFFYKNTCFTG